MSSLSTMEIGLQSLETGRALVETSALSEFWGIGKSFTGHLDHIGPLIETFDDKGLNIHPLHSEDSM